MFVRSNYPEPKKHPRTTPSTMPIGKTGSSHAAIDPFEDYSSAAFHARNEGAHYQDIDSTGTTVHAFYESEEAIGVSAGGAAGTFLAIITQIHDIGLAIAESSVVAWAANVFFVLLGCCVVVEMVIAPAIQASLVQPSLIFAQSMLLPLLSRGAKVVATFLAVLGAITGLVSSTLITAWRYINEPEDVIESQVQAPPEDHTFYDEDTVYKLLMTLDEDGGVVADGAEST